MALVHKEKNSAFGVQFPDVPGCFSAADEMDDLVANATEALSLWADDQTPPKPRSHAQIMADRALQRNSRRGRSLSRCRSF
jgi:predicted RNase H-like HicB family nuclease